MIWLVRSHSFGLQITAKKGPLRALYRIYLSLVYPDLIFDYLVGIHEYRVAITHISSALVILVRDGSVIETAYHPVNEPEFVERYLVCASIVRTYRATY